MSKKKTPLIMRILKALCLSLSFVYLLMSCSLVKESVIGAKVDPVSLDLSFKRDDLFFHPVHTNICLMMRLMLKTDLAIYATSVF